MIKHLHINSYGGNQDAQVDFVKADSVGIGRPFSLQDIIICDQEERRNCFVLSRFVEVQIPLKISESGKELQLVFQEIHVDSEKPKAKSLYFRAVLFNEIAQSAHEMISDRKLSVGDIVGFCRPTVVLANRRQLELQRDASIAVPFRGLFIELGSQSDQLLYVWQPADCFPASYSNQYRHISIYDMEQTGSIELAVKTILDLIKNRGKVRSIRLIDIREKHSELPIVLAQFQNVTTPLKTTYDAYEVIALFFKEIKIGTPHFTFSCNFNAYLYGEVAEEIEKAVNNKHITPGDLVALVHPVIERVKPIVSIDFPYGELKNLVVLRYKRVSSHLVRFAPTTGEDDVAQEATDLNHTLNAGNFKVWRLAQATNKVRALKCFMLALKKYGRIIHLNNYFSEGVCQKPSEDKIIFSCFLKILSPLQTIGQHKRAILLHREVFSNFAYGHFFKVVVHNEFAEEFFSELQAKEIVSGDIVAFVNMAVMQNPKFTQKEALNEEPFLVETSVVRKNEKILILTLRGTKHTEMINSDNLQPTVTSSDKILTARQTQNKEGNIVKKPKVFVVDVLWPKSNNALDHISGYCSLSCHNMVTYSNIIWNALKQPLCPACLVQLRLFFCLELYIVSNSNKSMIALLLDKKAEKFLEVTSTEFLNSVEARNKAMNVLKKKIVSTQMKDSFFMDLSDFAHLQTHNKI